MLFEFLSDPFINEHIKNYANKGSDSTSYLSKIIYEEVIELMAKKVRETIIVEVKKAKYYCIIVDYTPDISHVDQIDFILRYVLPNGVAAERFVKLLDNVGYKGTDMYNAVKETLESLQININDLRGQSYDNVANISDNYKMLQALIKKDNPLAQFTPCAGHGLNTVDTHAAES
ncbi:uncharacterized protein LOC126898124 [Daktulosphaira vitifoliae]|uniref:uncharacterized protein LOC126898124 n=1 Tax=Daktulosphaira vitifoliae TaxID=58002 RepID=UPI0021A9B353|nr:uncharacterized protein LOC126898124 [Daktulosphaira vitifoliae]